MFATRRQCHLEIRRRKFGLHRGTQIPRLNHRMELRLRISPGNLQLHLPGRPWVQLLRCRKPVLQPRQWQDFRLDRDLQRPFVVGKHVTPSGEILRHRQSSGSRGHFLIAVRPEQIGHFQETIRHLQIDGHPLLGRRHLQILCGESSRPVIRDFALRVNLRNALANHISAC